MKMVIDPMILLRIAATLWMCQGAPVEKGVDGGLFRPSLVGAYWGYPLVN